ncbi:unnamed protein product, partial [Coregonus sp. 'balchen']
MKRPRLSPMKFPGGVASHGRNARSTGTLSPLSVPPKKPQPWVQVGASMQGTMGGLLKRYTEGEQQCCRGYMEDSLRPFVPGYHGVVQRAGQDYKHDGRPAHTLQLPAIMDCKMGT